MHYNDSDDPERTLIHEAEYDEQIALIEKDAKLSRALLALTHYMACDPTVFDLVPDSEIPGMRVAESRRVGQFTSRLRILYTIEEDGRLRCWAAVVGDGELSEEP